MSNSNLLSINRRKFLQMGASGTAFFLSGCLSHPLNKISSTGIFESLNNIGSLLPPDNNGIMLPKGFKSRIVAKTGVAPVTSSNYIWHPEPDGGATFAMDDGGWVYVSNSEVGPKRGGGGVGALRFSADGTLIDAYPILTKTRYNCAGGATPWGTWLSCEETRKGLVYECDPRGNNQAVVRPLLGAFKHEACAVDVINQCIYLTEDTPDGGLYRFVAHNRLPDLGKGHLEIATLNQIGQQLKIEWVKVPDPYATSIATRKQVKNAAKFRGGEGIAIHESKVYFTTKHDNKVWVFDIHTQLLDTLYDIKDNKNPILKGVDNITITPAGDVLVAEDKGDMQLVVITPEQRIFPFMQIIGHEHSELAGPAFDPSYKRLYISSQRGLKGDKTGITYEISYGGS